MMVLLLLHSAYMYFVSIIHDPKNKVFFNTNLDVTSMDTSSNQLSAIILILLLRGMRYEAINFLRVPILSWISSYWNLSDVSAFLMFGFGIWQTSASNAR